ncbi:MAG: hypothetical protein JNM02_04185 [Anaerolineales bacterium]|nr:hypothetical protein [Anaerolineales bacterium]
MKYRLLILTILVTVLAACAPASTPTEPTVDVIGTRAMELAVLMQTQTAMAYSPTPPPTFTPEPTATATIEPTPVVIEEPMIVNGPATCYVKQNPGPGAPFTSNISDGKIVELLAVGSTPGWYKIMDPYFNSPCWVTENNISIDENMDLSVYPVE